MVVVNCPIQQDVVINILEEGNEKIKFKFINKEGMKLFFESSLDDLDLAVSEAKSLIKASDIGKALYFSVNKA